jgi:hypothetical protein
MHGHTIRVGLFLVRLYIDTEGGTHPRFRLLALRAIPCGDIGVNMHRDDFAFPWQSQFRISKERVVERCDIGRVNRIVV